MDESVPIVIDYHHNAIGDIVVGCWLVESAKAVGRKLLLNCRTQAEVPKLLGIGTEHLTSTVSIDWPSSQGAQREFLDDPKSRGSSTRFDYWCETVGLPELSPVRPKYEESADSSEWATKAWDTVDPTRTKTRILIFPDAAWKIRTWPLCYYMDVIHQLREEGFAVAAMGADEAIMSSMNCHWWSGFSLAYVAAMAKQAELVIANDSGPAHLAGTIGIRTLAICGGSNGWLVFGHDSNVATISLDADELECVGCHYSNERGCRTACQVGGCQALMLLRPNVVSDKVLELLRSDQDK